MHISDLKLVEQDNKVELSAQLDDFRLRLRFPPDVQVMSSIDPFLAWSYLPAIALGGELTIAPEFPISRTLRERLDELQILYRSWNYEFPGVKVTCTTEPRAKPVPGIAALYSGGVDSMYTLLRHQDSTTHMVRLFGFDVDDTPDDITRIIEHDREFAAKMGKHYVPVETNFRQFCAHRKLHFGSFYACGLYAATLALGFTRCYYPSSHTFGELFPECSHPLTDPLWSNGQTQFVHDICIRRSEKIRHIVKFPHALENLHVCWVYPLKNCGYCSKCLRTMATLRMLGATSESFPSLSLKPLKKLPISTPSALSYIVDNFLLAEETQDWEIHRILKHSIRRYQLSQIGTQLDQILLAGTLRRLYHNWGKPRWLRLTTLKPKNLKY